MACYWVQNGVVMPPQAVPVAAGSRNHWENNSRRPDWRRWSKLSLEGIELPQTSSHAAIRTIVHSLFRTSERASKCLHKKKRWRSWLLNWTVMTMKILMTMRMTMEPTSMAFSVDHFVHNPFAKPLARKLDINSRKQFLFSFVWVWCFIVRSDNKFRKQGNFTLLAGKKERGSTR